MENEILIQGFSSREGEHLVSLATRGVAITIMFWLGIPSPLNPGLIELQTGLLAFLVDVSRVGMLAGLISVFWLADQKAHRQSVMFPVLVVADYFIWIVLALCVLMAGIGYAGDYFLTLPGIVEVLIEMMVVYLLLLEH